MKALSNSLQLAVLTYVFLTTFLIMIILGTVIFFQMHKITDAIAQQNLLNHARQLASYIEYNWRGQFELDLPESVQDYYKKNKLSKYAVFNSRLELLFHSDNFQTSMVKDTFEQGGKHYFDYIDSQGRRFSGLKYDYLFEGNIYPLYVIEHEEDFSTLIKTLKADFEKNLLIYGLPLLIFQAIVVILIFRLTLRPVLKAARKAQDLEYNNLSFRLDEQSVHSEIRPLFKSLNQSLARLEASAETQKLFIANAAHELRTPISILKTRISKLSDRKEAEMLDQDIQSMNRLITQMLDISRLNVIEKPEMSKISLNDIAKDVCAEIAPLFLEQDKPISLREERKNQYIHGNPDMVYRALLNLVENAYKHTPPKSEVCVIIDKKKIIVRDFGAPIPIDLKGSLFENFTKLPESSGKKGSGLGLAIVRKTAEIHNGKIEIISRKDGNDFVLDFTQNS